MVFSTSFKFANTKNKSTERSVRNGLSLTPSQMLRLSSDGKAIAMHSLEGIMQNVPCADLDNMPSEFIRGIDETELWELSIDAQDKLRKFKKHQEEQNSQIIPV